METERRQETITMLQIATTVAVVLLALLMVTFDRPLRIGGFRVLPTLLGITGLTFTAIGLLSMDDFRARESVPRTSLDVTTAPSSRDLLPLLFEIGLWALGVLYVVRLVEIARG